MGGNYARVSAAFNRVLAGEQCMTRRSDPNPAYWEQDGPFQHVKHELIRCDPNGWFPKLGTWAGRVLYVDTHAGRGRYRERRIQALRSLPCKLSSTTPIESY